MKLSGALRAELIDLVASRTGRARITITGTSMEPLLRAGMVIDVQPLAKDPRIGDILVFEANGTLVAHRLVGGELFSFRSGLAAPRLLRGNNAKFLTSGDAFPDREEVVPVSHVVGRVCAVWDGDGPDARRIDDARFRRRGWLLARTRKLRSLVGKLRASAALLAIDPADLGVSRSFAALTVATREFEAGRHAAGVAVLARLPCADIIAMARRHHASGLIAQWFADSVAAGVDVPAPLRNAFTRMRWINALQAGRILQCVGDVRDRFVAAGIAHIVLKGGARLGAAERSADLQFSGDLDVLVPATQADAALAVLRAAGYADMRPLDAHAGYRSHHHREPLVAPRINVPVEIHVAIAEPAVVGQRLDYEALVDSSRCVDGPVGEIRVLDEVASAVHLAYHARDFHVWRDIVLLARKLTRFDAALRARFDTVVRAEHRDGLRLACAVAAADALAFGKPLPTPAIERYIAWVELREELPRRFVDADIAEAVLGRCHVPKLQFHGRHDSARWLRTWLTALLMLPAILRLVLRSRASVSASDSQG